jgi:hypothetical protein
MTAPNWIYVAQDANHSIELPSVKRTPVLQQDLEYSAVDAVRRFVEDVNNLSREAV